LKRFGVIDRFLQTMNASLKDPGCAAPVDLAAEERSFEGTDGPVPEKKWNQMAKETQRRAHPRIKCTVPIVISNDKPRMLSSALMLNYSEGGAYFEISSRLDTGACIIVKTDEDSILDPVGFGTWNQRQAEVRWCLTIETSGAIRYGCGVQYIDTK
jgi:hypothetical protein